MSYGAYSTSLSYLAALGRNPDKWRPKSRVGILQLFT